jgi:hypothetical protein
MKKLFVISLILLSCTGQNKYAYVEHDLNENKDPAVIMAMSDLDAYSQAYEKFLISKKVSKDMQDAYNSGSNPISFEILNKENHDICADIDALKKDSIERELAATINPMKTMIKEHYDNAQKVIANAQENCPVKIITAKPVQEDYSNYKSVYISYKNVSKKTITGIKFKWEGINVFGEPADMGATGGTGGGFTDDKLRAGRSDNGTWNILSRDLKKVTKAWVYEVAFDDGTKWELNEQ